MSKTEAKKRIAKLIEEVRHHRYLYHVLDKQEISDAALDSLKRELAELEKDFPSLIRSDSPTQRVGGRPLDKFIKVKHATKILSLADAFNMSDLEDWQTRNKRILATKNEGKIEGYYTELKLDGLTVVLTYKNGVFWRGATRGDGQIGEEVTKNLKTIESIPLALHAPKGKKIPETVEIRGEVVMDKNIFKKLNKDQERKKLPLFANPRNVAAGSIRQLDSKIAARRKLDCIAFELITDMGQKTHEEVHQILAELGFKTSSNNKYCKNLTEVDKYLKKWVDKRKTLSYWTDGAVVVTDDIVQEKLLGHIGKAERWMIAYKFPAEQVTTKVLDIEVQVGRTGALTPVAILEPVSVAGSTVSRATLHNQDEIKRLGVRVGDTVIIQKAGDIIPDIVQVMTKLRDGSEKRFIFPKKCPTCDSLVSRKAGKVAHYCTNKHCYAQNVESIIHFVSKKGFNIEGLGNSIVAQLVDTGLVVTPADIFRLTSGDLSPLERFANKKADNLLAAIGDSKTIELDDFLYALGIRHVGEETSIVLANHFGSLDRLKVVNQENLEGVSDVGPEVAKSILAWFEDEHHIKLLDDLLTLGIKIKNPSKVDNKFSGQTFLFTGSMNMNRDEAKDMVRQIGGKIVSSVSGQLNYLIAGEKPGSKLNKAKAISSVKILNENDFLKLLKN